MVNVIDSDVVRAEIEDGLLQVDENLATDTFDCFYDKEKRKLSIVFTATNRETEQTIEINEVLG